RNDRLAFHDLEKRSRLLPASLHDPAPRKGFNRLGGSSRRTPAVSMLRSSPCPSSPCRALLPVHGEKDAAACLVPFPLRLRLAKETMKALFSPFTGRRWRQPDEGWRKR